MSPGDDTTLYPVIADPWLFSGGVQDMVAELRPAAANTPVGGSGRPIGVTGADGDEATEGPNAVTAITVNV